MKVSIEMATPDMASHIASLIMEAMSPQCCQNLAGPNHTLADFHRLITNLVGMEDSQYSYRNTLVAMTSSGILAGVCVVYDGGQLRTLRRRFIEGAKEFLDMDHSEMQDETEEGEFYIDSLCVSSNFRGRGFATQLLEAAIERAKTLGFPAVGLLVDNGNPKAEELYTKIGFQYVGDTTWGGHPMKHLQYHLA